MVLLLICYVCLCEAALTLANTQYTVTPLPCKSVAKLKLMVGKMSARSFELLDNSGNCMFGRNSSDKMNMVKPAVDSINVYLKLCRSADQIRVERLLNRCFNNWRTVLGCPDKMVIGAPE